MCSVLGESVANLADILGTTAGILLSRMNLPLRPTFCVLSLGYLVASRKEVDAVELPYFNRARLALATRKYFQTGIVPGKGFVDACHGHFPFFIIC